VSMMTVALAGLPEALAVASEVRTEACKEEGVRI
jgi:hypothetical protein